MKSENRWVMLMFQLPTKPSNLRVKVWRRLQKLGAVGIRNSAYVLPYQERCIEDFQWLRREIIDMGGQASVFIADSVDNVENEEIEQRFREARESDYKTILKTCSKLSNLVGSRAKAELIPPDQLERYEGRLQKIIAEFDKVKRIDFFSSPLASEVEQEIERLRSYVAQARGSEQEDTGLSPDEPLDIESLKGKTWVTRRKLHIDRIASGWLIQRFIDAEATFEFVDEADYTAQSGHVLFDMYGADFGHHGEFCTFEMFVRRLGLTSDPALAEIAEIVHDIDLKDAKFGRPEARGIDEIITGLGEIYDDDQQLMDIGGRVFDALYVRMGT